MVRIPGSYGAEVLLPALGRSPILKE